MKKIYFCVQLLMVMFFYSCIVPYQVTTTLNEKGEVTKDIYYLQERGDSTDSYFPYMATSGWEFSMVDTLNLNYAGKAFPMNKQAIRNFSSLAAIQELETKEYQKEFFTPVESFRKQFRWFYTYYTYEACFPETIEKGKVSIFDYLTQEEVDIWLKGKNKETFFKGMNGMEMNQLLQDVEGKFLIWLKRNLYEVVCDVLEKYLQKDGEAESLRLLKEVNREEFFNTYVNNKSYLNEEKEINAETIAGLLDKLYESETFSHTYINNKTEINEEINEWWEKMEPDQGVLIKYRVELPGKIVSANTEFIEEGIPYWRINLAGFLMEDYMVMAQSRKANTWAYLVTILLIGLSIGFLFKKK